MNTASRGAKGHVAPPVPDFSDRVFLQGLSTEFEPEADDCHASPPTSFDGRKRVVSHFQSPSRPAFFFHVGELADLATRLADEDPDYREAVLEYVAEQAKDSFHIYGARYEGLTHGFAWGKVKPGPGGDDLYPIRPHRFGFAPAFGLAAIWEPSASSALETIIRDWLEYVRVGGAAHAYVSNLVVIQRILALHWTWIFLCSGSRAEEPDTVALQYDILKIIHADARFLSDRAGQSAPNNHILADGFGLWYLGLQFPEFRGARKWRQAGESLWLKELERQIYDDGTSFEHSVHYQEICSEMALMYLLLSRRNGLGVPASVDRRIQNMLAFQASCLGKHGVTHYLGDAIEEPMIPLDLPGADGAASLRQIHDALFPPLFETPANGDRRRGRAFWLLAGVGPARAASTHVSNGATEEKYPRGGYFFLTDVGDSRFLFRTGPDPGEAVFGGHMHSDLLSVYLTIGADPVIVEAGTYTYRAGSRTPSLGALRSFFMGPECHNGLVIPGHDPLGSVSGDFRDKKQHARVRSHFAMHSGVLSWVEGQIEEASVYSGHRRGVLHIAGEYFVIYDLLNQRQVERRPRIQFQLSSEASPQLEPSGSVSIKLRDKTVIFSYAQARVRPMLLEGSREPMMGWISERYGVLAPSPSLSFHFEPDVAENALLLATRMRAHTPDIEVLTIKGGLAIRVTSPEFVDYILLDTSSTDSVLQAWNMEFVGRLVWLRRKPNGKSELRCLEAIRFSDGALQLSSKSGRRIRHLRLSYDNERFAELSGDTTDVSIALGKGL